MGRSLILLLLILAIPYNCLSQDPVVKQDSCIDCYGWDAIQSAQFPEGMQAFCKYIVANTVYPKSAIDSNITGKVKVRFVIEKDGSITNVKINEGTYATLDSSAIKVIRAMPKWIPAKQHGHNVRMEYLVPINFKISNSGKASVSQCDEYGK